MSKDFSNKLFSLNGHQYPNIWKFIKCMKSECSRVTGVLLQLDCGIRQKRQPNEYMSNSSPD